MVDLAETIFRNFEIDGVPSSGVHKPIKGEIREWGTDKETRLTEVEADIVVLDTALDAETLSRQNADTDLDTRVDAVELIATAGIAWKTAVRVATTANVTLSGEQTIDGVLTSSSRILVKDQTAPAENGPYVTAAGAWTRATDADTGAEMLRAGVFVEAGSSGAGTSWVCSTPATITVGTTALTFVKTNDQSSTVTKTSELIRATGEMSGSGALTDKGVNNDTITATNTTDGAALTWSYAHVATGIKITLTTASKDVIFSTRNISGGKKTRIRYHAIIDTITTACRIGMAFSDGVDTANFFYTNTGTLAANGVTLSAALPTFVATDYIDIEFVLDADAGTVNLFVSKNGGAPYAAGVSGIPLGLIYLLQRGNSVVTHSTQIEAISELDDKEIRLRVSEALSMEELKGTKISTSFMQPYKRTKPSGFPMTIPSMVDVALSPYGPTTFFGALGLKPMLSRYDPKVCVLHVDVATGVDANAGTEAAPLKSLYTASIRGLMGSSLFILAKGGLYTYDDSFRSANPASAAFQVVSSDGVPVISSVHDTSLSWTLGAAGTYSATFTLGIVNVWDAKTANLTADGSQAFLVLAASQAACEATAGTYFIDGTTIYVHHIDGRAPDADTRVYKKAASGTSLNYNLQYRVLGGAIYCEGVEFHGGVQPFVISLSNPAYSFTSYAKSCKYKYGTGGGYETNGAGLSIIEECVGDWTDVDGFHYNPIFGSTVADAIEWNCNAGYNGVRISGSTSNGSSSHGGNTLRVRTKAAWGLYHHSYARGVHDISDGLGHDSYTWNVGIVVRDGMSTYTNFAIGLGASDPSRMWNDGVTSDGSTSDFEAPLLSIMRNAANVVTDGVNIGAGTHTSYTP